MNSSFFILLLLWQPALDAKPVHTHMVYPTKEDCERNIVAMQKVFEVMQNPTAVMACQPLNLPK
jgi:hypothetical protein